MRYIPPDGYSSLETVRTLNQIIDRNQSENVVEPESGSGKTPIFIMPGIPTIVQPSHRPLPGDESRRAMAILDYWISNTVDTAGGFTVPSTTGTKPT